MFTANNAAELFLWKREKLLRVSASPSSAVCTTCKGGQQKCGVAAFEANPLDLHSNKKYIPKLYRRLWRTDNNDGVQVSWAHLSPACCAFLQGFGSRMLHSLLLVWPGMRAICRCFRCDAGLTTFISHSSVNPAGTRTNCASEEDKPHLFPCMVMFNIPARMWCVRRMCTWTSAHFP